AGRRVQHAVHVERSGRIERIGPRTEEIGAQAPGDLEILEVLGIDLLEGRIAVACQVAAVSRPLRRSRIGRLGVCGGGHHEDACAERKHAQNRSSRSQTVLSLKGSAYPPGSGGVWNAISAKTLCSALSGASPIGKPLNQSI